MSHRPWRRTLIKQRGELAGSYADDRMQLMLSRNDAKGAAQWLQIGQAIDNLNAMVGEVKH